MSCKASESLERGRLPSPYDIARLIAVPKKRNEAVGLKLPSGIAVKFEKFGVCNLHHFAKCFLESCGIMLVEGRRGFFSLIPVCINGSDKSQRIDYIAFVIGGNVEFPQCVG